MKFRLLALAAVLALGACTARQAADTAASVSATATPAIVASTTAQPSDAKTVAEATIAADLTWKALGLYISSGLASPDVVARIQQLAPPVHNALKAAQAAQRAGNSAGVAAGLLAFNSALAALRQYEASKVVAQ